MQKTVTTDLNTIQNELIAVAKEFSKNFVFIPCFRHTENGKARKPPCKDVKKPVSYEDLHKFPTMEILSLHLGDEFIVIDIDGAEARKLFDILEKNIQTLPETLYVTSDPFKNTHGCYFFRKPNKDVSHYTEKLTSGDKLEFRTGDKKYQAIAGLHPSRVAYYSDNIRKFPESEIPYLPDSWVDYIQGLSKFEVKKTTQQNNKIGTLVMLLDMLEAVQCENVSVENYDTWVRVGMIFHSIDPSSVGFDSWKEWSYKSKDPASDKVFNDKWESFSDRRKTISIGSIFYWFKQEIDNVENSDKKTELITVFREAQVSLGGQKYIIEDRTTALLEFKQLGLNGENLDIAIKKLCRDIYGTVSQHLEQTLWEIYYRNEDLKPEEQQAYYQAILDAGKDVDTTDALFALDGCYIVDFIKSYFVEQDIQDYYFHGLICFITAICSILPKGMKFLFNQDKTTTPIMFTLVIAKPARGKNAITDCFTNPLIDMTLHQQKNYEVKIKEVNKQRSYFSKLKEKEKKTLYMAWCAKNGRSVEDGYNILKALDEMFPMPDEPHVYATQNFTIEKGRTISGEQKSAGFLVSQGEFASVLNSQNKYSKGGSKVDVTEYLDAYDGAGTLTHRQGDGFRSADRYQMSILSTIQMKVLEEYFNIQSDDNGFLSRCNLLQIESAIEHKWNLDPDNPDVNSIEPMMMAFYQDLITTYKDISWEKPLIINMTKEAKGILVSFVDELQKKREKYDDDRYDGYFAFLSRFPVKISRIIMAIHILFHKCGNCEELGLVTSREVLEAIRLGRILLKMGEKVYGISEFIDIDYIEPTKLKTFQKIIQIAEKRGGKVEMVHLQSQAWRGDTTIINTFFPGIYKKSLGKRDFIFICMEAAKYGFGDFDPITSKFTVSHIILDGKKKVPKKELVKV